MSKKAYNAKKHPGNQTGNNVIVERKYDSQFCHDLVEHMSKGKSIAAFAAKIGVARDTIYKWKAQHPEFALAMSIAQPAAQAYLEDKLDALLNGSKEVNVTAVIFALKTRFHKDYGDKMHNTLTIKPPQELSDEQLKAAIAAELEQAKESNEV